MYEQIVKAISSGKVDADLALMRCDEQKSAVTSDVIKYAAGKITKAVEAVKESKKVPFIKNQKKIVSRNAGTVSPDSIEEYIALGGYSGLAKVLSKMSSKDIIKEVKESKLRGRGGAGFPAGLKWEACSKAKGDKKYIVCNGSEGDPEIGMHRSFLESDPHSIIEGMIIAGYAVGADEGYVYLNDRYLLGIERMSTAIKQAEKIGLLGEDIFESGFSLL